MKIAFDPDKDASNQDKHGVSLAFGAEVLGDPKRLEILDVRFDYAEESLSVTAKLMDAFGFVFSPSGQMFRA